MFDWPGKKVFEFIFVKDLCEYLEPVVFRISFYLTDWSAVIPVGGKESGTRCKGE